MLTQLAVTTERPIVQAALVQSMYTAASLLNQRSCSGIITTHEPWLLEICIY